MQKIIKLVLAVTVLILTLGATVGIFATLSNATKESEKTIESEKASDVVSDSENAVIDSNSAENIESNDTPGTGTEDTLQGLWLINSVPYGDDSFISDGSINYLSLNFTSNGNNYTKMGFVLGDDSGKERQTHLYYGDTMAYDARSSSFSWSNESYRYINISSKLSEVSNGEELLSWLQTNGAKVEDPLSCYWIFNDITIIENEISIDVNFTSGGETYSQLLVTKTETIGNTDYFDIYYDNVLVGDWNSNLTELDFVDEKYYQIYILDDITAVENCCDLLEFLQANGYKPSHAGGSCD